MIDPRRRPVICAAAFAALLYGCGSPDVTYRPTPQILPQHIRKLAVRNVINKTQQFGLEDKLTRRVIDEFLRDGRYAVVPLSESDGYVECTVTLYRLDPIQYDAVLTPTVYKLRVLLDVRFVDKIRNRELWTERKLQGVLTYHASTLPGGKTEEQAREEIWDQLAQLVVKRTIEGFGAVSGASDREISSDAPPGQAAPALPPKPVNPEPY